MANSRNNSKNTKGKRDWKDNSSSLKGKQGSKDSKQPRVNFDNERVSKFLKDFKDAMKHERATTNPYHLYNKNPLLTEAAARIPFSSITGARENNIIAGSVPGVMSFDWQPSLGEFGSNIINRAAQDYYSFVVHANSRNTSYTASDLMIMSLAVGEIFSALALGCRAYGIMRKYKAENAYTPSAMIAAGGFLYDDLQSNYSHMWFDLNNLIAQTNTLWTPNTLPFIERRVWVNSNIYKDADSVKAQMYMFRPYTMYKYSPFTDRSGGQLLPILPFDASSETVPRMNQLAWETYVGYVQSMIDAVNNDEDRGLIMGDILKAYGTGRLITFNSIPLDYEIEPVYEPSVLMQIENMVMYPTTVSSISQDSDLIYAKYSSMITKANATVLNGANNLTLAPYLAFLNAHQKESPIVEQVVEMTRFTALGATVQNTANTVAATMPFTSGSEFICAGRIYYFSYNSSGTPRLQAIRFGSMMPSMTASTQTLATAAALGYPNTAMALNQFYSLYTMFDWAPAIYNPRQDLYKLSAQGSITFMDPLLFAMDLDNYVLTNNTDISRIHTACLYSEFGLGQQVN